MSTSTPNDNDNKNGPILIVAAPHQPFTDTTSLIVSKAYNSATYKQPLQDPDEVLLLSHDQLGQESSRNAMDLYLRQLDTIPM
eukprot:Pgem_evm1s14538